MSPVFAMSPWYFNNVGHTNFQNLVDITECTMLNFSWWSLYVMHINLYMIYMFISTWLIAWIMSTLSMASFTCVVKKSKRKDWSIQFNNVMNLCLLTSSLLHVLKIDRVHRYSFRKHLLVLIDTVLFTCVNVTDLFMIKKFINRGYHSKNKRHHMHIMVLCHKFFCALKYYILLTGAYF